MIEGVFDKEGAIHLKITILLILHPRQHALNKIEKLGQMKWVFGRFHHADKAPCVVFSTHVRFARNSVASSDLLREWN